MKKKSNKRDEDYRLLKDVVKDFVDKNRLQNGLDNVDINTLWRQELGQAIAKYTTQITLKKGTLYVDLSSSALRNELSYGKEKIISILNRAMQREVIKKLVLR